MSVLPRPAVHRALVVILVPLLTLLTGCGLTYTIDLETRISADGSSIRRVSIREKNQKTWQDFAPPDAPYEISGTDATGVVASCKLPPGAHPNGLRPLIERSEGDYHGAEGARELRSVQGELHVEVHDILIGKMFHYRETVTLGIDMVRFRKELPMWLELGADLMLDTLRRLAPDLDLSVLETHVRTRVVPILERRILELHERLCRVLERVRFQHDPTDEAHAFVELVPFLDAAAAELGLRLREGAEHQAAHHDQDEYFDPDHWNLEEFLDGLVFVHLNGLTDERRRSLATKLIGNDGEQAWEAALRQRFPEKDTLENPLWGFITAALGLPQRGLFDRFELSARASMPGRVLFTNGDLTRLPEVTWALRPGTLFLVDPHLHAFSFLAEPWLPTALARALDARRLGTLQDKVGEIPAEERAAAKQLLRRSLELDSGWEGVREGALKELSGAGFRALFKLRKELVTAHEDPPR